MKKLLSIGVILITSAGSLVQAAPARPTNRDAIDVMRGALAHAQWKRDRTPVPPLKENATTPEIERRLRALATHRLAGRAVPETKAWLARLAKLQADGKAITALDHVAVGYVLRTGLGNHLDDATREQAEDVLVGSWRALTGKAKDRTEVLDRLPQRVLRAATPEARLFHMASFQADGRQAPIVSGTELGQDYVPTKRDAATAIAAAAIASTGPGAAVLGPIALGSVTDAAADYFNHRFVAHEGVRQVQPLLDKLGPVGKKAKSIVYNVRTSHLDVHHRGATNAYYDGKLPADVRKTLDSYIAGLPDKLAKDIRRTEDGIKQTPGGALSSLSTSFAINTPIALATGKAALTLPLLMVPAGLSVLALSFLHPRLHDPLEVIADEASPVMKAVLQTRYVEHIARLHFIHHQGGGGNYNLGLQGVDYLFGTLRKPNMNIALSMHDQHLVGAYWGNPDRKP